MDQHGGVGDGRLQLGHGRDHLRCDGKLLGGAGEGVRQGADDVGEAREETAVEVSHAEEALDVQLGGRRSIFYFLLYLKHCLRNFFSYLFSYPNISLYL